LTFCAFYARLACKCFAGITKSETALSHFSFAQA